jgi:replication factor A1
MILERLQNERARTGGLISDDALLRMIAASLGCYLPDGESLVSHGLSLKDLISGLNNISVVGRIVAVFSSRSFSGAKKGRFSSVLIADKSGIARLVLWNDMACLTETGKVKVGDVVRFRGVYTRQDFGGKVELQGSERCSVEVNPADLVLNDYPFVDRFAVEIQSLPSVSVGSRVILKGTVLQVGSLSEFKREDSSEGKVFRFVLSDGSGEVSVVIWNEKVDEVQGLLKVGAGLNVVYGRLKRSGDGRGFEVHVDNGTFVGAQEGSLFSLLSTLTEGLGAVSVSGELVSKPMLREVKTARGEAIRLATFELKDESGSMWVSVWRDHAETVKNLTVGERIVLQNVCVKRGFGNQLELSTKYGSAIIVLDKTAR